MTLKSASPYPAPLLLPPRALYPHSLSRPLWLDTALPGMKEDLKKCRESSEKMVMVLIPVWRAGESAAHDIKYTKSDKFVNSPLKFYPQISQIFADIKT